MKSRMKSPIISRSMAILLIICFFLPWVTVSCRGTQVTGTGFELATGIQGQEEQGNPLYFIIPTIAVVIFVGSFLTLGIARIVYIVNASVGLIFMAYIYFYIYFQDDTAQFKTGYWLSLIALFATLLAGYLAGSDKDKEEEKIQKLLEQNKQKSALKSSVDR